MPSILPCDVRLMNLPNYITLLRIVLIPFFVYLMIYGFFRAALLVFIVACVTDALDGLIARLTNQKTDLGAFLDPMADKLLIISAFVTLVSARWFGEAQVIVTLAAFGEPLWTGWSTSRSMMGGPGGPRAFEEETSCCCRLRCPTRSTPPAGTRCGC